MDIQSLLGAAPQKAPPAASIAAVPSKGETVASKFTLPEEAEGATPQMPNVDADTADQPDLPGLPADLLARTGVLINQPEGADPSVLAIPAEATVSVDDTVTTEVPQLPLFAEEPSVNPEAAKLSPFASADVVRAEDGTVEAGAAGAEPPLTMAAVSLDGAAPATTGKTDRLIMSPVPDAPPAQGLAPPATDDAVPPLPGPQGRSGPFGSTSLTPESVPARALDAGQSQQAAPSAQPQALPVSEQASPKPMDPLAMTSDAKQATAASQQTAPQQAPVQRDVPLNAVPLPPAVAAMPETQKKGPQPTIEAQTQELAQPRETRAEPMRPISEIAPAPRQQAEPTQQLPQPSPAQGAVLAPDTPAKPAVDTAMSGDLAKFAEIAPATDVRGTQSTMTTQTPGTMAPEPVRPPTLQIVEALRLAPGTVDLVLVPEELGRLTLSMAMDDGTMAVTVTAERADTLDLVRRNATLLEAEARAAGFDNVSFTFSGNGSDGGGGTGDADSGAADGSGGPSHPGGGETSDPDVTALPVSGSLDLRL